MLIPSLDDTGAHNVRRRQDQMVERSVAQQDYALAQSSGGAPQQCPRPEQARASEGATVSMRSAVVTTARAEYSQRNTW
jgi:hypothetical protein